MKKISFETLNELNTRQEGLTEPEVLGQRSRYGKNEIVEVAKHPWIALATETLKDPMIWFLLGIGTVFILVGDTSEAIVLFVAILPLLFMDAILHWRTQASTETLKGQLSSKVTTLRSGKEVEINSQQIVPGDLIFIKPGLFIPADGVFQEARDLQIDESALTGEAFPMSKSFSKVDPFLLSDQGEVLVDPNTLGFAGTRALTGLGKMRVLYTGQRTSYGQIVQTVSTMPHERTPLQISITNLVRTLIFAAAFLCLLLAGIRIYQGHGWLDALLSAATLAVAAIPEEFPVVFTFFLGVGVYRLAKRRALIRRAVSVENIGRVTHICTDKTGTITMGVLHLTHMEPFGDLVELDLLKVAFAASNHEGSDPVDIAIRDASSLHNLTTQTHFKTFPFTEDRKRKTTLICDTDGNKIAYLKGSPETVLAQSDLSESDRQHWRERTAKWARGGHKVLACAKKNLSIKEANSNEEPISGFSFCGLLAFEDPARPEVNEAIAYCHRNGINVLMITGDHKDTAVAIAKDVGLGGLSPIAISAEDEENKFEEKWLEQNPDFLRQLHVVARCTPLQKLRIVTALKRFGELVAVTGDGVNDVPALKAADIGIAMGERGTRSAKEVASIILVDDNFRTIVGALREGRQLFINLVMSFKYLLYVHVPLVLTAAVIPLLGHPLLYLPVHIVWLELIIHPSALFAFQQPASTKDERYLLGKTFFSRVDKFSIVLIGLFLTLVLGLNFISGLNENIDVGHARGKVMVMLIFWSAGVVSVLTRLKTLISILIVTMTLVSTVLFVQIPFLSSLLHLTPLHLVDWLSIGAWILSFMLILFSIPFIKDVKYDRK